MIPAPGEQPGSALPASGGCETQPPEAHLGRLYRLLAELFRKPPDQALVARAQACFRAAELAHQEGNPADLAEIGADFVRLFLGPRRALAPPWESVYATGQRLLFQPVALQVRKAYLSAQLAPEGLFAEPDDHVSLELEFLAILSERARAATEAGDSEEVAAIGRQQADFLEKHAGKWIPSFCDDISRHAVTRFWKSAALLTRELLAVDRQRLALSQD